MKQAADPQLQDETRVYKSEIQQKSSYCQGTVAMIIIRIIKQREFPFRIEEAWFWSLSDNADTEGGEVDLLDIVIPRFMQSIPIAHSS